MGEQHDKSQVVFPYGTYKKNIVVFDMLKISVHQIFQKVSDYRDITQK